MVAASDSRNSSGPTTSSGVPTPIECLPALVIDAFIGGAILRGVDHARRDQVEFDAMLRDFLGGALYERDQRALGRRIGRSLRPALMREAG